MHPLGLWAGVTTATPWFHDLALQKAIKQVGYRLLAPHVFHSLQSHKVDGLASQASQTSSKLGSVRSVGSVAGPVRLITLVSEPLTWTGLVVRMAISFLWVVLVIARQEFHSLVIFRGDCFNRITTLVLSPAHQGNWRK